VSCLRGLRLFRFHRETIPVSVTKKPRTMPGLSGSYAREILVLRHHRRAAPVKAPHQLGADGLHGCMLPLGEACLPNWSRNANGAGNADDIRRSTAIIRVAVFALPEQPGQPSDRVFRAATNEEAYRWDPSWIPGRPFDTNTRLVAGLERTRVELAKLLP
jgi:hypothetical protein